MTLDFLAVTLLVMDELSKQIEELNKTLRETLEKNRYFIYATNPFKFFLYNFIAGLSHSIGSFLGTIVILGIVGYIISRILSQIDITGAISNWVQSIVSQTTKGMPHL